MAVPNISAEDRAKALEKAQKVRKERAAMREEMKSGKMTLGDVLARRSEDVVGGMRVNMFLNLCPGSARFALRKLWIRSVSMRIVK